MKRCTWCGGKFGLIRWYRYRLPFCSKACKKAWLDKQYRLAARRRRWLSFLSG